MNVVVDRLEAARLIRFGFDAEPVRKSRTTRRWKSPVQRFVIPIGIEIRRAIDTAAGELDPRTNLTTMHNRRNAYLLVNNIQIVFEPLRNRVVVGQQPSFHRIGQATIPFLAEHDRVHGHEQFASHDE